MVTRGMASGLQRRLMVLLLLPLCLLSFGSAWFDYRLADSAAVQKDRQLLQLMPLLGDSVVAPGRDADPPILLLAPAMEEFLAQRPGPTAYAVTEMDGRLLHGARWLAGLRPATREPEFHSVEERGVTYRLVVQRVQTVAGELVLVLADGSDPRLDWVHSVLWRVVLPNLLLISMVALAVRWAIDRALRPLKVLAEAVSRRSPRDLDPIDEGASPEEVRPLVQSINRLFGLVNAQAESQRRFIADAAHQLRTPLAGLQAQVEAWAHALEAPAGAPGAAPDAPDTIRRVGGAGAEAGIVLPAEQLYKLRGAARRTSQLANQLLALSRADERQLDAQAMQRVDLKALCETVLEAQLDAATARGIDLGLEAEPAQAMGHDWLLRELLGNLVDNAIKYTREGGTVTLRCGLCEGAAGEGPVFLEVEDDGPGLPPQERDRVVERFYRMPGTPGEGSGLGLAIASEIARLHHSQLELLPGLNGQGLRARVVMAQAADKKV